MISRGWHVEFKRARGSPRDGIKGAACGVQKGQRLTKGWYQGGGMWSSKRLTRWIKKAGGGVGHPKAQVGGEWLHAAGPSHRAR